MKRRFTPLLALAAAVAFAGAGVFAAVAPPVEGMEKSAGEPGPAAAQPRAETPVGAAGMMVAIDPESGELRMPTAEEIAELRAQMESRFAEAAFEPQRITLKNGGEAVELDPSLWKYAAVRVEADGTLSHHCLQGHHAATEFVATTPAPAVEE
jgi:hypothetical protein